MLEIPIPRRVEGISLDDGNFDLPFFDQRDVPGCYCARMARFAARFIFDKKFPIANAWNLREKRRVIFQTIDSSAFELLATIGMVSPGIIAGFYNKNSIYNEGNKFYTHLGLYLGKKKDKLLFMDQYVDENRVLTLGDYQKQHLELKEIMNVVPKSCNL